MVLKIFSARVREARIAAGMTQAQLDAALGLQPGATAKWEAGARLPQHENLDTLAEVFKKPYAYFFSGEAAETIGKKGATPGATVSPVPAASMAPTPVKPRRRKQDLPGVLKSIPGPTVIYADFGQPAVCDESQEAA